MHEVWKYELNPLLSKYEMPAGAEILSVREQNGKVCLWAKVNTMNLPEEREIIVVGTGHPLTSEQMTHLGTAHLNEGTLVLHVFEIRA